MKSFLVLFISTFALGAAQMTTFSDGWEKRQSIRPVRHYAHQRPSRSGGRPSLEANTTQNGTKEQQHNELKNASATTELTECMVDYLAGVRKIHAAIIKLYSRFQTCENSMTPRHQPEYDQKTSSDRL